VKIGYLCHIQKQKNGIYFIKFPDFDEAFSEEETLRGALNLAGHLISITLEGRLEENLPIPRPIEYPKLKSKEFFIIYPNPRSQISLLARFHLEDKYASNDKKKNSDLLSSQQGVHYISTIHQLERMSSSMGFKLVISFENDEGAV
jgi:antitoxin HicB